MFVAVTASFADRYWVGGTGNWNDTAHWTATSGSTVTGASVPGTTDNVYFDGSSGTGNCLINAAVSVLGFSLNNHNITILQQTFAMTFGVNTIGGAASNGVFNDGTFTGGSAAILCSGNLTIGANAKFMSTTVSMTIGGNFTLTDGGTFTHNSGTVAFSPNTYPILQHIVTGATFNNLTFTNTSYPLTFTSAATGAGTFTPAAGTTTIFNGFCRG